MAQRNARTDLAVALVGAICAIAGSFALTGWSDRFLVVSVDQAVIETTPAWIVNRTILLLGEAGHALHIGLSLAIVLAVLTVCGLAGRAVAARTTPWIGTLLGGALAGAVAFSLAGTLTGTLVAAAATFVALWLPEFAFGTSRTIDSRRGFLGLVAGLAPAVGVAAFLGRRAGSGVEAAPLEGASEGELLSAAEERSLGVDGLDPLVTSSENFFTVDIASSTPSIDPDDWQLDVTGAIDESVSVDYEELREMAPVRRFATLRCVSDTVDGDLLATALWTGVPMESILAEANPGGDCECVMVHAEDGYYQEFPTEALRRSILVYGMNGESLPAKNGAPVRLLVPGHWGEINVKWLSEIEILEEPAEGFWEERGWHGTGPVETVAKLTVVDRSEGRARLAGQAYAGTRGVSEVSVSTDGGDTWDDADLSEPLPEADWPGEEGGAASEDVWRQWEYSFEGDPDSEYDVVVRAVEESGEVQPREEREPFPNGASGWARRTI